MPKISDVFFALFFFCPYRGRRKSREIFGNNSTIKIRIFSYGDNKHSNKGLSSNADLLYLIVFMKYCDRDNDDDNDDDGDCAMYIENEAASSLTL